MDVVMGSWGAVLIVFAVGPLVGGLVLDLVFGLWARWWRWWFPPFVVSLAGVGFLIALAVKGQPDEPGVEYNWSLWFSLVFIIFLLFLLGGARR